MFFLEKKQEIKTILDKYDKRQIHVRAKIEIYKASSMDV